MNTPLLTEALEHSLGYLHSRPIPKVYLAGPISGLTYDQGQDWRIAASLALARHHIAGYSPLRAKAYLRSKGVIDQAYEDTCLSCDRGIITRDRWDVMTADAVLFYLVGATKVSVGTIMELGWADAFRKPTVVIMEDAGNVHEHPMVREVTGFRVTTLEEGIEVLDKILNPYNREEGENRGENS
jgi:nucleoside 2-deoxyribosyltransferase